LPWLISTGVGVGVEACVAVKTLVGVTDDLMVFVGGDGDGNWVDVLEGGLSPRRTCASCRGLAQAIKARRRAPAKKTSQHLSVDQRFMFSHHRFEVVIGPFSFRSRKKSDMDMRARIRGNATLYS
jgi:hypothetical protein